VLLSWGIWAAVRSAAAGVVAGGVVGVAEAVTVGAGVAEVEADGDGDSLGVADSLGVGVADSLGSGAWVLSCALGESSRLREQPPRTPPVSRVSTAAPATVAGRSLVRDMAPA
jgi:hypothetical protein